MAAPGSHGPTAPVLVVDYGGGPPRNALAREMLHSAVSVEDTMRIAIAVWNDRISPVFDTSSRLLLVDVEQGAERDRRIVEIGADAFPTQRARRLTELEVNVLICGAVSRVLAGFISAAGVVVIPWVSGPTEGVLRAYLTKRLSDSRWRMPGCRGRWRHRNAAAGLQDHRQT